jgi:uncharacterized membrane protein YphA (DoxX/SURF4 family)
MLIVFMLVPESVMRRNFWTFTEHAASYMQQIDFMKNLFLFGAALIFAHCGSGALSVDKNSLSE